jgi:HSP20 family protein
MSKKAPWWRKPSDRDDEDDVDEEEHDYKCDPISGNEPGSDEKRTRKSQSRDDWQPRRRRFGNPFFDDDFDGIFGRSPFGFGDEMFGDMEREFGEMHERMDRMFKQAMDGKLEKAGEGGPLVYGFSMRTGPDGVPHIQEFGNMPPEMRKRLKSPRMLPLMGSGETGEPGNIGHKPDQSENRGFSSRKPLTDLMECDDHLSITMELPGIEKKDIDLQVVDNELEINVDTPVRKYYNKLPLPGEVDPNSISANFKNGVLDVILKRLKSKKQIGKKVNIE